MAATRTLELTLISAKDLKEVSLVSKMAVYAVVSLSGDPRSQRVNADRTGGRNPTWNARLRFAVPATGAGDRRLQVRLRAEGTFWDSDVGEVNIPLSQILSDGAPDGPVAYKVKISGGHQGDLNLSYKLGEVTQSASSVNKALNDALIGDMIWGSPFDASGCAGGASGCAGGST